MRGSILKKKTSMGIARIEPPPPISPNDTPINAAAIKPITCITGIFQTGIIEGITILIVREVFENKKADANCICLIFYIEPPAKQ